MPIAGKIVKLFDHRFGGEVYTMAIIELYDTIIKDNDSKLWWADMSTATRRRTFPVAMLSPPLVIAYEVDKVWFLDCLL